MWRTVATFTAELAVLLTLMVALPALLWIMGR